MAKSKPAAEPADLPRRLIEGECYYLFGPRFDFVGRLVSIDGPYTVTLEDAALVMYSGRVHEFFRDGRAASMQVEPVGVVGAQWVAWRPWPHPLFAEAV